jgi:hypothetical protein
MWLFEALWSLAAGYLLARTLRGNHVVLWAACFGFAIGLWSVSRAYIHSFHYGEQSGFDYFWARTWTYLWSYGRYLVPCAGAAAGAFLTMIVSAFLGTEKPDAA